MASVEKLGLSNVPGRSYGDLGEEVSKQSSKINGKQKSEGRGEKDLKTIKGRRTRALTTGKN